MHHNICVEGILTTSLANLSRIILQRFDKRVRDVGEAFQELDHLPESNILLPLCFHVWFSGWTASVFIKFGSL